jgi:hypothetical protein
MSRLNLREAIKSCIFRTEIAISNERRDFEWLNSYFSSYSVMDSKELKRKLPSVESVDNSLEGLKILMVNSLINVSRTI